MKLYSESLCGLVGQVGHSEIMYWECVWFRGTGNVL